MTATAPQEFSISEYVRDALELGLTAEQAVDRLDRDPTSPTALAIYWLVLCKGDFPRSLTKRQVMVLPYGGTKDSFFTYTREWLDEHHPVPEGGLGEALRDLRTKRIVFLASRMWDVCQRTINGGMLVMQWLRDCTEPLAHISQPVYWDTPSGFIVRHFYGLNRAVKCELRLDGTRLQLTRMVRTAKLSIKDQLQGIPPNFIHSLDAAALVLCLERCRAAGIEDVSAIHDAYGTHAANMEPLSVFLREAFVEVHQHDVLGGFRNSCKRVLVDALVGDLGMEPEEAEKEADGRLPPVPPFGNLDIGAVIQSDYFFA